MSDALLIFSVGPVQSFIAQARRTADLYAGSQLLTQLIGTAIDVIGSERVVYPRLMTTPGSQSLPNKLIAQLPADQAADTARETEKKIRERWREIARPVAQQLAKYVPPDEKWRERWTAQLSQLPDVYWTVTTWEKGLHYKQVYDQAGWDFDARKRLRSFGPIEERGRKCTVCGERSALHLKDQTARDYWTTVAQKVGQAKLRPDGKEQLCAICTVKRFGGLGQERFPSVSEMAVVPFKQMILNQLQGNGIDPNTHGPLVTALEQLTQALTSAGIQAISQDVVPALAKSQDDTLWEKLVSRILRYDGEWFFLETYERAMDVLGQSIIGDRAKRDKLSLAREAVQRLLNTVQDLELTPSRPSPYYALLMADGDQMGEQIRNAATHGPEKHVAISEALAEFASREVYRLIEEKYAGRVMYTGGDDVLALLPLPNALAAAEDLRQAYSARMAGLLEMPTMSAGIAIAHHLSPLSQVLQAARQAEHAAKEEYGRSAITVAFLTRGGAPVMMASKWVFADSHSSVDLLLDIQQRFAAATDLTQQEQGLSLGLAHTLLDEARFLGEEVPAEARLAEVERLLYRAAPAHLPKEARQRQAQDLASHLVQLARTVEHSQKAAPEKMSEETCLLIPQARSESGLITVAYWLSLQRFIVQETGIPLTARRKDIEHESKTKT